MLTRLSGAFGRLVGALVGLLVGLLLVGFGFWKGLFVILCVGVGYVVGQRLDGDQSLEEFLSRLFPQR